MSGEIKLKKKVKENIEPLDNTFNVDNLKPVKYNLKSSKELSTGFIAHELQEEFPFLVQGEKDGKDIQAINYSGLISILVKEIQDLIKFVGASSFISAFSIFIVLVPTLQVPVI